MRKLGPILLALALLPAAASAQEVEFSLKATPTIGSIDDTFQVVIQQVVHGVDAPERYLPPEMKDFTVLDQRSQTSTQWVLDPRRGQQIMNVVTRWYRLKANRAGKLRIGEAKIKMGGQDYATKPLVIDVQPAGKGAPPAAQQRPAEPSAADTAPGFTPPDGNGAAATFIHVSADRSKVFLGEQVTVTWLLYTRSDVLKFEPKPPRLDGFWVETLFEPQNYFTYHEESVGGRDYSVAVIAKRALYPTKVGKVVIPRYEADVSTLYTSFASPLKLSSPELTLDVQPLPAGAPPGFDSAYVGNFSLEASVDRDTVTAGESLTLALKVSGAGAIRRAAVPNLVLDGFEVTPRKDFTQRLDTSTDLLRGERRYTYLLTPLRGGKLPIPAITIPFFDPGTGKYEVARTETIPVAVIGDPSVLAGKSDASAAGENVIGREIRPLREEPVIKSRMVSRFYRSRLFNLALALPLVIWVLIIAGDRVWQRMRRETPRARLRRARGRARRRLRSAEIHIRGGRAGKFFGEVSRVLQEHIEERVGEPVTALTRDQLRDLLTRRGFPEETVDALVRELENCDFARFAPSASGPGEMRASLRRVRALLGAIERVRPAHETEIAA